MKTSNSGLEFIKRHEGFRATAYPDPGSSNGLPWTIGYGHTNSVYPNMVISRSQADSFLITDLRIAEGAVSRLIKVRLNQNQFDALVSFTFNVGVGALERSTLRRKLNEGRYSHVPSELKKWNKNDGVFMSGLAKRRKQEGILFMLPVGDKMPTVTTNKNLIPVLLIFVAAVAFIILKITGVL